MSDWKEVIEEGQVIYVNDEYGNIVKLGNESFLSLYPKIIKFGPFSDLEHAKSALIWQKEKLDNLLEEFNNTFVEGKK